MQVIAMSKVPAMGGTLYQTLSCLTKYRRAVRIMKLTAIILLGACIQLSAKGISQTITLSLKDAPIQKLFKEIERQTDYTFFLESDLISKAQKVTVSVKNLPLNQVLDMCFKDLPFTYSFSGKIIIVTPKQSKMATDIKELMSQRLVDIKGRIVNSKGEPISDATVSVRGSTKRTITNANGEFFISGVDDDAVVIISHVQYETMTLPVKGDGLVSATLQLRISSLDELQVIAYGTTTKRFSTGNITTIKSSDIEKQPVQNPLLALQGRVPGLEITQTTGLNGGNVKVRIQGINSFGSLNGLVGTEPLIVVDGVPYPSKFPSDYLETLVQGGSPLNYINTSDIESISVLKDADATAIYGSRAANGAILITTKKAKAGKPKLSFDLQQGWGKVTRSVKMMNTRQYLDMRYEAYKNSGVDLATQNVGFRNYDLKLWDTTRYTNWQKELIGGTAQYTNINAGISGGTDLVQYLISGRFNRQTSVFPGNYDDKAGGMHFSLNGNSSNQRLRIQLSGSYTYDQNRLPGGDLTSNAVLLEPVAPKLYNDDGTLNWAPNASGSSTWNNPLAQTFATEFNNVTKNLVTSMNIGYTIFKGLVFSSNLGYNNLQSDLFQGIKLEFFSPESRPFGQRSAKFGKRNISSWIIEPQLQYSKNISKGKLDVLFGTTAQKTSGNYFIVEARGQSNDELLHSLVAATSVNAVSQGTNGDYVARFNGLFGRINYNWNKKYLINLTGRRDGSSKFGEENKFHNFWSTGIGWIFSEEKWIAGALPFLSFAKLRASYGTTGNDQIADYSYLSLYKSSYPNIPYQGANGFVANGLSNTFLQWEETRKLQGGIDLSIFNERVALSITYVRNRSSNQLVNYSLPNVTGFTSFIKNFPATIQNINWELSLNTINVKSKNIVWNTNFNLTIPRNKVINFPGIELTSYAKGLTGVIIGEPIGIMKLYPYGGVDPATGSYMLLDVDGKPGDINVSTSAFEQSAKVSLLPKYYGGMTNSITYKGFQLDFLFQFVYQKGSKDLYYSNGQLAPGAFFAASSNQPVNVIKNHWQKADDLASIGRYTTSYQFSIWPYLYTDEGYSYAAGSFIRLKNASLSWQIPENWSRKVHIQNARVFFHGQNLATITKYKGLDPETRSISTLPPLKMWTVGAKIEL
jgi:TonB-linked SusC/RagA family outer membrane protein